MIEPSIAPDPCPWCVVELSTEMLVDRFPTEWSALVRAERINAKSRSCRVTVDLAPREPTFRFTLHNGVVIDQPGADVATALARMQRHEEEFSEIEQLPYAPPTVDWQSWFVKER